VFEHLFQRIAELDEEDVSGWVPLILSAALMLRRLPHSHWGLPGRQAQLP
jgi:hypothetical protein